MFLYRVSCTLHFWNYYLYFRTTVFHKLFVKRPMHKPEFVWWTTSYCVLSEHISPLDNFKNSLEFQITHTLLTETW